MGFWRAAVAVAVLASVVRNTDVHAELPAAAWPALQLGPLALTATAGLFLGGRGGRVRGFTVALWTFLAVAAASSLQSDDPRAVLFQVAQLAVMIGFVLATQARRWTTRERLVADIRWLGWLVALIHGAGLVGHFTGALWAEALYGRYQGLYLNPNYAGISAALAFLALLAARRRKLDVAGAALAAFALLASGSRGALVAAAIGLLVLACLPATRGRLVVYAWFAAVVVTVSELFRLGLFAFVGEFFAHVRDSSDPTAGRLGIYALFWERWQESPLLGTGYQTGEITVGAAESARGTYVVLGHNVYLSTLVELGVVGLAVFAGLLLIAKRSAARRHPFLALFVAVMVFELTESTLFGFGNPVALLEWLCLAAYVSTGFTDQRVNEQQLRERQPA